MAGMGAALAQQFFGKPLEQCSVNELQAAVERYPYAAPLHLLLLSRLEAGTPEYTAQYEHTILHFPTPAHLHFVLHSEPDAPLERHEKLVGPPDAVPSPATPLETKAELDATTTQADVIDEPPLATATDGIISPQTDSTDGSVIETADKQPAATPPLPMAEPVGELSFEPYHTVDYFASQGIKLSREEVGTDKFGKQLKSFTEWLKTMKRIPAPQPNAPDTPGEKGVSSLAERSVADALVVTESMAEVWEKQGAVDKAADVYRKLSLLHPSKSAYFAAKIEALKAKK